MTLATKVSVMALIAGLVNAACLGLEPAPQQVGPTTPSSTPTASATATATAPPPSPTATSSPTPSATTTPTPAPLGTGVQIDPLTGQPYFPTPGPLGIGQNPLGPGGGLGPSSGGNSGNLVPTVVLPNGTVVSGPISVVPTSKAGDAGGAAGGGAATGPTATPGPDDPSPVWGCNGDERMEFLPPSPAMGEKTFIFVTASKNRSFGLIIGPGLSGVQGQDVSGGLGLKKRWEFTPPAVGTFTYRYYGGPYPEHLCVTSTVTVGAAVPPGGPAPFTPTPRPPASPTPLGSPRPDH